MTVLGIILCVASGAVAGTIDGFKPIIAVVLGQLGAAFMIFGGM